LKEQLENMEGSKPFMAELVRGVPMGQLHAVVGLHRL
jgi:hypothetical protein